MNFVVGTYVVVLFLCTVSLHTTPPRICTRGTWFGLSSNRYLVVPCLVRI